MEDKNHHRLGICKTHNTKDKFLDSMRNSQNSTIKTNHPIRQRQRLEESHVIQEDTGSKQHPKQPQHHCGKGNQNHHTHTYEQNQEEACTPHVSAQMESTR